jgi:hypothetical protein
VNVPKVAMMEAELTPPALAGATEPAVEVANPGPGRHGTIRRSGLESARALLDHLYELAPDAGCILVARLPAPGGSTMLGVHLATASVLAGRRTVLIDCDLTCPALAPALDLAPAPGMTEYLTGAAAAPQILQPLELSGVAVDHEEAGQLVCVTAGQPVDDPHSLLASSRFEGAIGRISRAYELVVLLGGSPLDAEMGVLLPYADAVAPCAHGAEQTGGIVRRVGAGRLPSPEHPTGLVVLDRSASQRS